MKTMKQPWLLACLKGLLGVALLLGSVALLDSQNVFFDVREANDHREKRWDHLRHMSRANVPVDVVVLGNSHAYTGISPEFMSGALKSNAFVLANPGTTAADCYWNLKALLELHQPRVVALETYALDERDHHHMNADMLVNQIKAFQVRKHAGRQWASSLSLFPLDDLGLALSETVRNHHYTWEGFPSGRGRAKYSLQERHLGQFIRFTTGMTDSLVQEYGRLGPVVDGSEKFISDENRHYAAKIAELCAAQGIELMLFTLPMYKDHVANAEPWMARFESLAEELQLPYLNLQTENNLSQNPTYFENTREPNQHMTFLGSVAASDRLSAFIEKRWRDSLPFRGEDPDWVAFHSGNPGLYAYAYTTAADENAEILAQNATTASFKVDQIVIADVPKRKDIRQIWVRLSGLDGAQVGGKSFFMLRMRAQLRDGSAPSIAALKVPKNPTIQRDDNVVFTTTVKALDVLEMVDMSLQTSP